MVEDGRDDGPAREVDPAGPERDWMRRHLWEITPIRDVLIAIGLVGFLLLGARLSIVTVPFLVALMFAYLFDPLLRRFDDAKFFTRRSAAAIFAIGASLIAAAAIAIALGFAAIQSARLASSLSEHVSQVLASVDAPNDIALREKVGGGAWLTIRDTVVELRTGELGPTETRSLVHYLGIESGDVSAVVDRGVAWFRTNTRTVAEQAITTGAGAVGSAVSLIGSFGMALFGLFLTAFFFYFFATEWSGIVGFLKSLLPERGRDKALAIATKMDHAISGFIRGRMLIALFLAVFYTTGFAMMGVPAPLLMGVAIALLSLVPYAVIAGIPVVIVLLWLESLPGFRGTWWFVLGAPIAWYQIGQFLDDYVLTPTIQGEATDLATPEIVFASIAAGSLFGMFGLLIAIPLAACLKILAKEVFWPRYCAWSAPKDLTKT